MTGYQNKASNMLGDYANIRSVPAMLGVAFVAASLYQFGGISEIMLPWIGGEGGYTLTAEHAGYVSLVTYLVAFMSSETKAFDHYELWEKGAIAAGPILVLGEQHTAEVTDFLVSLGDPLGFQIAFIVTVISWGVIVR